ncbi:MAG: DUF4838 domain-containing protein, partial [Clostridia bacterium]|nr:DUF4838 domain-containing protein [Clostridia bacterium]
MLPIFSACSTDAPIGKETDPSADKTISDTASVETEAHVIPDFYLMENGESDYVIVRGENASPSEVTASTELQSYIKQISGTELPIVLDTEAPAVHEIVVGKTNRESEGQFDRETLGDDGFVIDITEDTVWLVGGELRGTLYSVYTFLEEHLGCGFYTKDFEVIPQKKDIGLVLGSDTQIPVFLERDIDWDDISDLSYAVKLKVNGGRSIRYNETEELGGTVHVGAGHVLQRITGTSEDESGSEPCLSKESTYEAVRDYVINSLPQNPDDVVSINLGHGDVGASAVCVCADCRASVSQYGYSGHYLNFYNRIASEIIDTYKNTVITIFAYALSVMPPRGGVEPLENIVIQMCPYEFCHSHPLSECATKEKVGEVPENTNFSDLLATWGSICDKLAIYDYTADFICYNTILPNFDAQWHNMRLYADSNVK